MTEKNYRQRKNKRSLWKLSDFFLSDFLLFNEVSYSLNQRENEFLYAVQFFLMKID